MRALTAAALLLLSCDDGGAGGPGAVDAFTAGAGTTFPGVLRNCPPDPWTICPYAGAGFNGFNGDDVHRLDAWFSFPIAAAMPRYSDRPMIFDENNRRVRAVQPDPEDGFETVASGGVYEPFVFEPRRGVFLADGTLLFVTRFDLRTWDPTTGTTQVVLTDPAGFQDVAADPNDEDIVYYADPQDGIIQRWDVALDSIVVVATGFDFGHPGSVVEPVGGIALDPDGRLLYVADGESHAIRVVDLDDGSVSIVAGAVGNPGYPDGTTADARFDLPSDLALDPYTDTLYVADTNNHRIRAIDLAAGKVTTVAGTGMPTCPAMSLLTPSVCPEQHTAGDGGPAWEASLYRPFGVDLDAEGNLIVADTYNHRLRVVHRP